MDKHQSGIHLAIHNSSNISSATYNVKIFNSVRLYDPIFWLDGGREKISDTISILTQYREPSYKEVLMAMQSGRVAFSGFRMQIKSKEYKENITKEVLSKIVALVKTFDKNANAAMLPIVPNLCEEEDGLSLEFDRRFGVNLCTTVELQNLPMLDSVILLSFYEEREMLDPHLYTSGKNVTVKD